MSESSGSDGSRESQVRSLLLVILTAFYGIVFAIGFRRFAYGEPGGFPVFYTAGKLARYDLRGLYDQNLQNVVHPLNDRVGYFFHLPYETILLVPLSYLPQTVAFGVWSFLNLACLLGVALILRRHFPAFQWLLPFAFAPTLSLLLNGQDIGVLALVVTLAFDRFVREKDLQAGAILALGLFKFPLIVPLMSILAFRYRKVLLGFIAVGAPLLLMSALVMGPKGMHDYVSLTHGTDAKEAVGILVNLRGIIGSLFGPHTVLVIVLSVILVALSAFIKAARVPMFCIALVVTLLVSWHAHLYDALILLIPLAWMSESKSRWIQYTPLALILMTAPILLDPSYGYLLAIFLCAWLLVGSSMRKRPVASLASHINSV